MWGEVGAQGSMQKVIGSTKSKTRASGARWRNATSSMQPALRQLVFLRLFLAFAVLSLTLSLSFVDFGLFAVVGLSVVVGARAIGGHTVGGWVSAGLRGVRGSRRKRERERDSEWEEGDAGLSTNILSVII